MSTFTLDLSQSPFLAGMSQIATAIGGNHTCAAKANGTVWCWRRNFYGNLGDGTTTQRTTPVQVTGLAGVTQVTAGSNHTCAAKADGTVWCWGYNTNGNLGDGSTTQRTTPVQVTGLTNVSQVAAAGSHTCAAKSDGTVWCWGRTPMATLATDRPRNERQALRPVRLGLQSMSRSKIGRGHMSVPPPCVTHAEIP